MKKLKKLFQQIKLKFSNKVEQVDNGFLQKENNILFSQIKSLRETIKFKELEIAKLKSNLLLYFPSCLNPLNDVKKTSFVLFLNLVGISWCKKFCSHRFSLLDRGLFNSNVILL
jgi:hypothetical protein